MRLAVNKDINSLIQLRIIQQQDDWKEEFEDRYNLYDRTKEYFYDHLNKNLFMFIYEIDGEIVSTCGLQIIEYLPQCNDNGMQGYICNVYTKKEYRCKGIQTTLLKEAIQFAKCKKLCELNLSTDSKEAISIYRKLGFEFDDLTMKLKI